MTALDTDERPIAALFVQRGGTYYGLPNVDPWPEDRDATKYAGPHPVVAHPPCARWCRLAGLVEARWDLKRGDDGGLFESALRSVRQWGGVLEHPAYSDAWPAFLLPEPPREGWQRGICGGWSCHVEQRRYGHRAKKATWLYGVRIHPLTLKWGRVADQYSVSYCGDSTRRNVKVEYMGKRERACTPEPFRDVLLELARTVGAVKTVRKRSSKDEQNSIIERFSVADEGSDRVNRHHGPEGFR